MTQPFQGTALIEKVHLEYASVLRCGKAYCRKIFVETRIDENKLTSLV